MKDSYLEGQRLEDELERADTPEEIAEDNRGWQRGQDHDGLLEGTILSERVLEIRPVETFISYDLPLKPDCARTLQLLQEMYVDADGEELKPHYTDSMVVLHIPRTLLRRSYGETTDLKTEAPAIHGVSGSGR